MSLRLSCAPGCSPRAIQAAWAIWRRSRRGQKDRNGSISERDSVTTQPVFRPRSTAAWRAPATTKSGRPSQVGGGQDELPVLLVVQHVLAECGVQRGEAAGDFGHARLLRGRQRGAVAHEGEMRAIEQPALRGIEAEAVAVLDQRADAAEQVAVQIEPRHVQRVARARSRVRSPAGRRRRGWRRDCRTWRARGAAGGRCAPAPRWCWRSWAARRRRRWRRSRLRARPCRDHRRGEVFGTDAVEGRDAERGRPRLEERVLVHAG